MIELSLAKVIHNEKMSNSIYELNIKSPEIAKMARPGQFINLYTGKEHLLLPRPISICEIDEKLGSLKLIYQVVGKGTEIFSTLKKGDSIKVMGPLGNGFKIPDKESVHVIVGGGMGIPPLVELAKHLKGHIYVFLGFRSENMIPGMIEKFKDLGAKVLVSTDDGSQGFNGNAINLLENNAKILSETEYIYSCGPRIMLKNISMLCEREYKTAQVSMEERMACGIGVCVGCAVKIKKIGESDWQNMKVCKDGPVFLSNEVVWDE